MIYDSEQIDRLSEAVFTKVTGYTLITLTTDNARVQAFCLLRSAIYVRQQEIAGGLPASFETAVDYFTKHLRKGEYYPARAGDVLFMGFLNFIQSMRNYSTEAPDKYPGAPITRPLQLFCDGQRNRLG